MTAVPWSALLWLTALAAALVWWARSPRSLDRVILVVALVFNISYGTLSARWLLRADALAGWKYDYVLASADHAMGLSASSLAVTLRPLAPILAIVYRCMIPMMLLWLVVASSGVGGSSLALAYAAELLGGPLLYCIVPACGPRYAFHNSWPVFAAQEPSLIRLSGLPNCFPSLHVATAMLLFLTAPGKVWRGLAIVFLIGTTLATVSTGEHYLIDLLPGLAFGCGVAGVGLRERSIATTYLGTALFWSIAMRCQFPLLIAHPVALWVLAATTILIAALCDPVLRLLALPKPQPAVLAKEFGSTDVLQTNSRATP